MQDFATVQRALREVQEALDAATHSRAVLTVYTSDFSLVAGGFHRVSAQLGRTVNARLPAATGANRSEPVTLHLEGMLGTVRVAAAPGQLVNGQPYATFNVDGVVTLWSNGVNAWTGVAELPAESPGGAALDANYVLGAAHASLPNAAVGTDTAELDFSFTPGGVATWVLNLASVGFSKLANLTGLSVLGRAANSTGVMAAITATAARQTLRANDAGTSLEWGHPVEVRDSGSDQGDAFALDFVAGSNINLAASVVSGVATITPSVDLSSVTYSAGDGIDLVANQFSADVSDFAGTGLEDDGSNNLRIAAAAAGAGLTGGGGSALAVGAGTGITVNANSVQLSTISARSVLANATNATAVPTALQGTTARHVLRVNDAGNGLEFGNATLTIEDNNTAEGSAHTLDFQSGDGVDLGVLVSSGQAIITPTIDVSDFAGTGLEDDGSNNLRVVVDASQHGVLTSSGVGFRKSRQRHFFFEDFDIGMVAGSLSATSGTNTLAPAASGNWLLGGVGGTGTLEPRTPTNNHLGVWRLGSPATSGNSGLLHRGLNELRFDEMRSIEAVLSVATVTTMGFQFGLSDATSSGSNFIGFCVDTSAFGDTNIRARTAEAATVTTTDTGVALVAGAWNVYTIIQESPGTVDFYVDDVLEATHSANVPDAETGGVNVMVYPRTNAARSIDIDYISFESQSLGARTS